MRIDLLDKINEIPGVHFDDDAINKRARIPFDSLTSPATLEKLKAAMSWLIEQVKLKGASEST